MKQHAKDSEILTGDSLAKFYRDIEPKIKATTINWRIYELVRAGVLERVSRGKFRLGKTTPYKPTLGRNLIKISRDIKASFPYSVMSIWETGWLNEFLQHLTNKSFIIVEIEKDSCEPLFHKLQEDKKPVFLEPSQDVMEKYVSIYDNALLIKPLITEAPVQEIKQVNVPTLEKLLVDLYCDKEIFYFFQGTELRHIWENAFSKYSIQHDKLLRYANRRKRKDDVSTFIKNLQS